MPSDTSYMIRVFLLRYNTKTKLFDFECAHCKKLLRSNDIKIIDITGNVFCNRRCQTFYELNGAKEEESLRISIIKENL